MKMSLSCIQARHADLIFRMEYVIIAKDLMIDFSGAFRTQ